VRSMGAPMDPLYRGAGSTMTEGGTVDVLVIEDEDHVAELLADALEEAGYRVKRAADGLRGLEYATRYRPRLVLCDVMLPGLSGLEVLTRLRAASAGGGPPVVLMSAAGAPASRPPGVPFLRKPFDLDDLHACVQAALESDGVR
jgi:DNA-binding response OmpR family regulator